MRICTYRSSYRCFLFVCPFTRSHRSESHSPARTRTYAELDEREFATLRLACTELRNNYAILHDIILKNIEKIKQPRSGDHHTHMV